MNSATIRFIPSTARFGSTRSRQNYAHKLRYSDDALMHIIHKHADGNIFPSRNKPKRNNEEISEIALIIQYVVCWMKRIVVYISQRNGVYAVAVAVIAVAVGRSFECISKCNLVSHQENGLQNGIPCAQQTLQSNANGLVCIFVPCSHTSFLSVSHPVLACSVSLTSNIWTNCIVSECGMEASESERERERKRQKKTQAHYTLWSVCERIYWWNDSVVRCRHRLLSHDTNKLEFIMELLSHELDWAYLITDNPFALCISASFFFCNIHVRTIF